MSVSDFQLTILEKAPYLVLGAILLYSISLFFYYRRTIPPLAQQTRRILAGLRWIALMAVFVCLAEPLVGYQKIARQPPRVAILIDHSRSMSFGPKNESRLATAESMLKQEWVEQIKKVAEVHLYSFSDSLVFFKSGDRLQGNITAIGSVLEQLMKQYSYQNLAAVVLLSDGANNAGPDPVSVARRSGVPIYTCGIGSDEMLQDIAISDLHYPEITYAYSKLPIQVTLTSSGLSGKRVSVEIRRGKVIVTRRLVTLVGEGQKQQVSLDVEFDTAGLFQYDVTVPVQQGEQSSRNNSRQITIKVLPDKIRIGLITGALSWEYRFLKTALENEQNLKVQSVVLSAPQAALNSSQYNEELLRQNDVLIFLDCPGNFFRGKEARLRRFVEQDARGIVFLFGPSAGSSWNQVDQRLLPVIKGLTGVVSGEYTLQITQEGRQQTVSNLGMEEKENEQIWKLVPPLIGVVVAQELLPGARVLVTAADRSGNQRALPWLATAQWGRGKVLCLLGYPVWRWGFLFADVGRYQKSYATFWRNAIQWLVTHEDLSRVRLRTDRLVYKSGEPVAITGTVYNEQYQPTEGAAFSVTVLNVDSGSIVQTLNLFDEQPAVYQSLIKTFAPGHYRLTGTAKKAGQIIGSATANFTVEAYGLEDENLRVDRGLLEQIARESAGNYYSLETIDRLPQDLRVESEKVAQKKEIEVWQSPILFLLIIAFLAGEWALRKRYQLL